MAGSSPGKVNKGRSADHAPAEERRHGHRRRADRWGLALLYLGLRDRGRAWIGFDWDALDRLHAKGMISNPASKAKSVVFTEEGLKQAERLFKELFAAR